MVLEDIFSAVGTANVPIGMLN